MDRKLGDLSSEAISSGLKPSLALDDERVVWTTGKNVQFRAGIVEAMKGWSALEDTYNGVTPGTIRGMLQQRQDNGTQHVFFGDESRLYHWDVTLAATGIESVGSGYTGNVNSSITARASAWSFVPWGNWALATNGKDTPQIYKGTSFAAMTVPFTYAEIFMVRGPFVLAIGTSNGFNWVEWCDESDVDDWVVTADNAAGNLVIRDLTSPIRAAYPLGNRIMVFGDDTSFFLDYIGAPLRFGWSPALNSVGMVGKMAGCTVGRRIFGLGPRGFFYTDGVQHMYLDDPDIKEVVRSGINFDQAAKTVCWHNETTKEVRWHYPSAGSSEPDAGVGYNYELGVWTLYDFGLQAAVEKEVFSYPLGITPDGVLQYLNFGGSKNGSDLTCELQSRPMELKSEDAFKVLQSLKFSISGLAGTFEYRIGVQERLDDAISWGSWTAVGNGRDPLFNDSAGRWLSLGLRSVGTSNTWRLSKVTVYGSVLGGAL